jgi:hypothetical protein
MKALVKFIRDMRSEIGTFNEGDLLRCHQSLAKYLVDAGFAVYEG